MSYHFGGNEYNHLIGQKIGDLLIKNIEYKPDNIYTMTDGNSGKPYLLNLDNGDVFQFRQFQEVINKYGNLNDKTNY
jgi:hypothetical protein